MKRSFESGLTLIEIMVVITIIAVLAVTFGSRVFGAGDRAKAKLTQTKLTTLKSYIDTFQLQYNALPAALEDLRRCTERTGPGCVPIISSEDELKDAWDNPFRYTTSGRTYEVSSLGADGTQGGDGVNYDFSAKGP